MRYGGVPRQLRGAVSPLYPLLSIAESRGEDGPENETGDGRTGGGTLRRFVAAILVTRLRFPTRRV